jgi:hypothetical protein
MPAEPPDLHAYLDWLRNVWLPSITGEQPKPKRPKLTLIEGGRKGA